MKDTRGTNYSFDLLENNDSNCIASIMLPETFKRPDAKAFTQTIINS